MLLFCCFLSRSSHQMGLITYLMRYSDKRCWVCMFRSWNTFKCLLEKNKPFFFRMSFIPDFCISSFYVSCWFGDWNYMSCCLGYKSWVWLKSLQAKLCALGLKSEFEKPAWHFLSSPLNLRLKQTAFLFVFFLRVSFMFYAIWTLNGCFILSFSLFGWVKMGWHIWA